MPHGFARASPRARSNRSWRSPVVSRPAASASMPLAAPRPTRPNSRNAPRVSRLAGRTTHRRDPSRSGGWWRCRRRRRPPGSAADRDGSAPPGPGHLEGLDPLLCRGGRCRAPRHWAKVGIRQERLHGFQAHRPAPRQTKLGAGGHLHRNVTRAQRRSILPAFPRSLLASKGSTIAGVAQSAERLTRNEQVRGSIPRPGSTRAHQRKRWQLWSDQRKRLGCRPSQWLPSSSPSCRCIPSPVSRACHEIGPSGGSWLWRSASKRARARSSSPRMTPR